MEGIRQTGFSAPLGPSGHGTTVLALHIIGTDWADRILRTWPIPDSSGEAILFRQQGDQVHYLSSLRYRPGTGSHPALSRHPPHPAGSPVFASSPNARPRCFMARDYRGGEVFGVVYPVANTDWYLLAKIDKAELTRPPSRGASGSVSSACWCCFVTNAGIILLRQHTRLQMAEQLQHSQSQRLEALQLLSAIADSSEDAIFAKNRRADTSSSTGPPASLSASRLTRCWPG